MCCCIVLLSTAVFTQTLPDSIRDYKIHKEPVRLTGSGTASKGGPEFKLGEPEILDIGLSGIRFELSLEMTVPRQSGRVDRLLFHDLRVNAIPVSVEEMTVPFKFEKGVRTGLPEPLSIFVPAGGALRAAWKEMREPRAKWRVTGRVFVLGKFRRFGFYHKRAIPVDLDIEIPNPVR